MRKPMTNLHKSMTDIAFLDWIGERDEKSRIEELFLEACHDVFQEDITQTKYVLSNLHNTPHSEIEAYLTTEEDEEDGHTYLNLKIWFQVKDVLGAICDIPVITCFKVPPLACDSDVPDLLKKYWSNLDRTVKKGDHVVFDLNPEEHFRLDAVTPLGVLTEADEENGYDYSEWWSWEDIVAVL